jgi:hypothetical protein
LARISAVTHLEFLRQQEWGQSKDGVTVVISRRYQHSTNRARYGEADVARAGIDIAAHRQSVARAG